LADQPNTFRQAAEKNRLAACAPQQSGDIALIALLHSQSHNHRMVNISIRYDGDLHCSATHGPSQSKLATDAPTDNKGKGESFSPTDLVATALGTCMSTIMGMKAEELGLKLRGMTVSVKKEMSKDAPRRIVGLPSEVHIPLPPDTPQRKALEEAALNCPVHKSLPAEINRPTKFHWEG